MKKHNKSIINTLLYLSHFSFMAGYFFSPFFLPLGAVALIYLGIELSLIYFDGCFMTILQQKNSGLEKDEEFMENISKKFFKHDLTNIQHEIASLLTLQGPLLVAALVSFS